MNILEFIEELMEQGYSEESAEMCAYYLFSDDYENDFDDPA